MGFPLTEGGIPLAKDDLERKVDLAFLAAFYGGLLTENQRRVLSLHCEEDYSLSEIAEEMKISRQAAHETLTRAADKLFTLEAKLGMAARFRRMEEGLEGALVLLKNQDYARAEQALEELQRLDQEEKDGL